MINEQDEPVLSVPAAIIRFNSQWEIDGVNGEAEKLVGLPSGEMTGRKPETVCRYLHSV